MPEKIQSDFSQTPVPGGVPLTVEELFRRAGIPLPAGVDPALRITGLEDDSRAVTAGCAFVAVRGETVDGHRFIAQALEKGAAVVFAEEAPEGVDAARVSLLENTHEARGKLAHAFWGQPSRAMVVAGITGTNGKTTTAYLMESLLQHLGHRPALFGTVEYRFGEKKLGAATTTPGAVFLARAFAETREWGADSVVMEVSSHALVQGRVEGIDFDVALMTNLTQDHLDFHGTMEEYGEAKRLFFTHYRPRIAVFNMDDPTAWRFAAEHKGAKVTYGLDPANGPDIFPLELKVGANSIEMTVRFSEEETVRLHSPLRGQFNASNLLAAAAMGYALGFEPERIVAGLEPMRGAPGRFEAMEEGQPFSVYVDYACTPDAVERVLENVRAITAKRVIVVQGCGGDRDPIKRPLMGAAMGRLADYSIITSDNPRTEDPQKIADAMEAGIRTTAKAEDYEVCLDRREAIRRALSLAAAGDSVVISGKGHENYQEINKVKHHFDDREVVREICQAMFGSGE